MLLKFEAQGIYSLGKKVSVSFVARPKTRLKNTKYEDNFFLNTHHKAMKTAVFFGSNATGKTNLFLAIKILKRILEYGLKQTLKSEGEHLFFEKGEKIHLFISITDSQENRFDYELHFNADETITKEKLYKNQKDVFIYENSSLSSSTLAKNEAFTQIEKTIKNSKTIGATFIELLFNLLHTKEIGEFLDCVRTIEIHDKDYFSKQMDLSLDKKRKEFLQEYKPQMSQLFKIIDPSIDDFDFQTFDSDGEERYRFVILRDYKTFGIKGESEGVKKIIKLSIPLIRAVQEGRTIIVDELDSSITTLALIELFNAFVNTPSNQKGQLIISSHNLLLFDVGFLNSQQIFIVQKDKELCTYIKNYYEYDIRSEKKQAYINYLNGAYDGQ